MVLLLAQNILHLLENGEIDKVDMAKNMFSNKPIKEEVEHILHPLIFEEIDRFVQVQRGEYVFVEVPLLFEIQAQNHFNQVWCVVCDEEIALQRLQEYRQVSNQEAKRRLKTQMSVDEKMKRSSLVLYNNGSVEELKDQIMKELERLGIWC